MIKTLTASTMEIDDENTAVAEILQALDVPNSLMKNSLGVITCFSEFAQTGALQAICRALPFPCIGATSCLCATGTQVEQVMLAITVFTSDSCSFKTAAIDIDEAYAQNIRAGVPALTEHLGEKPKMMFSYLPLINSISGDMMITEIDAVTGGVPLFGTSAVDHKMDYSSSMTILDGEAYREKAVLCAVYGDVCCKFEIASLDESKIRKQKAIITKSQGNILIGVNGLTALQYLESIGLTKEELATGLGIIPLVVDHNDGTKPVARAVFALTPEGHAVCGGAMPVNATLSIGHVDMQDVLSTAEETMRPLVKADAVVLGYSCMARYLALGAHNTAEAEKLREIAGETNYMFACSGGEICPLPDGEGKLHNFYHNFTIVFCSLS